MSPGAMSRVLIIAEPGSTHEGKLDRMLATVRVAAEARADVFKAQWTADAAKHARRRNVPEPDAYRRIAFPAEWHVELWDECRKAGIEYACTVALKEELPIVSLFVGRLKVASFDAGDHAFIRVCEAYGKPVLISTGIQNAEELEWLLRRRKRNPDIKLLHCVSAYPAPIEELNLGVIREYGLDGFSDHSGLRDMGALAVAAGAQILEVHFRLDDTDPSNPDFPHSLPPARLREYVAGVRFAEAAMGDGVKRCMVSEVPMRKYRAGGN